MLYLPIKRTWILSPAAQRVYLVCAGAAIWLFGVVIASQMALRVSGEPSLVPLAALIVRLLLWPGIAGTALLSIAMWYFWFSYDESGWLRKALWFLPLYLFLAVGPALYYFFVYRRSAQIGTLPKG